VRHESVELDEGAAIEEEIDPLPRGQFPLLVLQLDPLIAAPEPRFPVQRLEFFDLLFSVHRFPCTL